MKTACKPWGQYWRVAIKGKDDQEWDISGIDCDSRKKAKEASRFMFPMHGETLRVVRCETVAVFDP